MPRGSDRSREGAAARRRQGGGAAIGKDEGRKVREACRQVERLDQCRDGNHTAAKIQHTWPNGWPELGPDLEV